MRLLGRGKARPGLWRRVAGFQFGDLRAARAGVDPEMLEELEERLLASDFGARATFELVEAVGTLARRGKIAGTDGIIDALRERILGILGTVGGITLAQSAEGPPTVYLVVGVNGTGKTTSVAKLAHFLREGGRSVLIAGADTYRAGAIRQLEIWADQVGADFVRGREGGDPAAVAFDAIQAARARGFDTVLVDTAGRLHTNRSLMEELRKTRRVIGRQAPGAPHETLIVLDATVGQNAVAQVSAFHEALGLTGIVLAKLDSSARGGVVVALMEETGIPVKLVGTGERVTDLGWFDASAFVDGILGEG